SIEVFMFIKKMLWDKEFWKSILTLAIPIALQNLLSSSLAIIDNLMIGRLGDIAVGAVGVSAQIAQLVNIFLFGITSGGTIFAAQYWGKKDPEGIRRTYGLVMLCCSAVSLLAAILISSFPETVLRFYTNSESIIVKGAEYLRIAAFSYVGIAINLGFCTILRSTEQVRLPVISNLISVVVNMILNAVLIFGLLGFPKFGIRGAAIATVIASLINPLFIFIVSFLKRYILRASLREMFSFPNGFVKKFFAVSLPVFFNEAMWALGVAGTNMVYGRMGESNIAALTITRTVENIAFVLIIGLCNACGVMIGKNIGKEKFDTAHTYAKRFILLVPAICLCIGSFIILLRSPILSLFSLSKEAKYAAMRLLFIFGLEMPLRNIPYISIVGIFRAGGDTRMGMLFDVSCLWCLALPTAVILGLVCGLDFLTVYPLVLLIEDLPKATLCILHTRSGRWIRSVT
ncbi:MAG: MATE family efflux transporter, partial [Clostridia bacterium]|nr:MATE family efflux transporter [Clostridia bacterium]